VPGFTATDLNNFQGTRTVEQGAREAVRLALLDASGPTGTFSNEDGPVPWWCLLGVVIDGLVKKSTSVLLELPPLRVGQVGIVDGLYECPVSGRSPIRK
jgi:hypothetical protein